MFGLFYAMYTAIVSGIAKIDEGIDNSIRRDQAKSRKDITYHDSNNQLRLLENNREVYVTTKGEDKVLIDLYNGKVYKNITKDKENQKLEEAVQKGKTVINFNGNDWHYKNKFWYKCEAFPQYKDIKNGVLYKIARINGIKFYMDVETGKIIRPIDEETFENKKYKVSIEDIIRVFNDRQDQIKKDKRFSERYWWWVKDVFYLIGTRINIDDNLNIIERN